MNDRLMRFEAAAAALPLVAILRGITPAEVEDAADVLYQAGFRLLEIPLNSPEPFDSIGRMRKLLPDDALVGAGTVLEVENVDRLVALNADLVIMPHADLDVIRMAACRNLICIPGIATPTEAFAAIRAGAVALKLFPAEMVTPTVLKAMRAVLPKSTRIFPVGGITPDNQAAFLAAGANGFGLGSALYKPGMSITELKNSAIDFVTKWRRNQESVSRS